MAGNSGGRDKKVEVTPPPGAAAYGWTQKFYLLTLNQKPQTSSAQRGGSRGGSLEKWLETRGYFGKSNKVYREWNFGATMWFIYKKEQLLGQISADIFRSKTAEFFQKIFLGGSGKYDRKLSKCPKIM